MVPQLSWIGHPFPSGDTYYFCLTIIQTSRTILNIVLLPLEPLWFMADSTNSTSLTLVVIMFQVKPEEHTL